ncbi:uncharacterized protein TRIREDRAFT_64757, partial [Trichoderma reesei QM6a]
AQIEAGAVQISNHLARFSSSLSSHLRPTSADVPRLSIARYARLYESCAGSPGGAHFVVHQHDHPVAGTHYDLRLQINETSSVSWAVMYGLPGDANSSRLSRNATETRIHCLWASLATRKIRLRLHGAKLPDPYVINLRLTKSEDAAGRSRGLRARAVGTRRRRGRTARVRPREPETSRSGSSSSSSSSSDDDDNDDNDDGQKHDDNHDPIEGGIRLTNAYRGASNTIGSVYQRKWYLSLDRRASGFTEKRRRGGHRGPLLDPQPASSRLSYPFYVRGPQFERSVVTGRLAEDVLRDEGVTGFVPRKGWMPVLK